MNNQTFQHKIRLWEIKNRELAFQIDKNNKTIAERDINITELLQEILIQQHASDSKIASKQKEIDEQKLLIEEKENEIKELISTNSQNQPQELELRKLKQQLEQALAAKFSLENQIEAKQENENLVKQIEALEKEITMLNYHQSTDDQKSQLEAARHPSNLNQSVNMTKMDDEVDKSLNQSIDFNLNQTFDQSKYLKQIQDYKDKYEQTKAEFEKNQLSYKECVASLHNKDEEHLKTIQAWSIEYDNEKKKSEELEIKNYNLKDEIQSIDQQLSTYLNKQTSSKAIEVNTIVQNIQFKSVSNNYNKAIRYFGTLLQKQEEEFNIQKSRQEKMVSIEKWNQLEKLSEKQQMTIEELQSELNEKQRCLREYIELNKSLEKQTQEMQEQLKNKQ